jgi:hypothetical protein
MSDIKKEMLEIYKPYSKLDWLNYKLVRKDVTLHHIIKREDGGRRDIDNLSLIMPSGHQFLHLIECKDIETYITLNKILKIINNQRTEPTRDQREIIEYLLRDFEYKHRWDKNSKSKLLIKREYIKRAF